MRERTLVIPHPLTPAEVDALIKIGEHLANISTRLAAMMEACGPAIVRPSRELAESIIRFLDEVDGDPDLEDGDAEPSLGWTLDGFTASGNDLHNLDCEEDIADQPHDADDPEDWLQPVRLDVFPDGPFVGVRHNG